MRKNEALWKQQYFLWYSNEITLALENRRKDHPDSEQQFVDHTSKAQ